MLYRVKQFISALNAKLRAEDEVFIATYLNNVEKKYFQKLRVHEQCHALKVAYLLQEENCEEVDEEKRIRLGLLHDIGKIRYPLNPVEKGIIVLLDRLTKGRIKKYEALKIVKCYYQHATLGYELLSALGGYEKDFLACVKNHHEYHKSEDVLLALLKKCDNNA